MESSLRSPDQALILLAEDRLDDIHLVKQAFLRAGIANPFYVVRNGEDALAYLEGSGKFADRARFPLPELLLLDLKMPRIDGFEVLKRIRPHQQLRQLRIVVLTSSQDIHDVNQAYQLGAHSFLVKPHEFENYISLARTMARFWFEHNHAPDYTIDEPAASSRLTQ
jgi:CheY-like chemotaxis protein